MAKGPHARKSHQCAVVTVGQEKVVVAAGGAFDGDGEVKSDVYSFKTGKWRIAGAI